MESHRKIILEWLNNGDINNNDIHKVIDLAQASPNRSQWFEFLNLLLLWCGIISIASAIIFFFAYNWNEMGRLLKFGLLEAVMVVSAVIYSRLHHGQASSTAMLTGMALLTGALLALTGQTYQTGADPWQLFAIWALLISPLAIIGRASSLWLLWLCLLNLSIYLHLHTFRGMFSFLFREEEWLWVFLFCNVLAVVVFEVMFSLGQHSVKPSWLTSRLAAQVAMVMTGIVATWMAMWSIFDSLAWGLLIYVVWVSVTYTIYRFRIKDLLILAGAVLSSIVVTISVLIKTIGSFFDGGAFLLVSLAIIGLSAVGGMWLKKVAKVFSAADQQGEQ
jgi:uncharacterized membrane protein